MSKLNKFIITALCSLMLVCSLTVFNKHETVIKADEPTVVLLKTQIATVITCALIKLGFTFVQSGYINGESIASSMSNLMSRFEAATNISSLVSTDFNFNSNKQIELQPRAVNYCVQFIRWLLSNFNISNSSNTTVSSDNGYYLNLNGSYYPVNLNDNPSYWFSSLTPILKFKPYDLNVGNTLFNLFTINSNTASINIYKPMGTNVTSNLSLIFNNTVTDTTDVSSYEYSVCINGINNTLHLLIGYNRTILIDNTSILANYDADDLVHINGDIAVSYNDDYSLPSYNDYGALVLNNTNSINSLTDAINNLQNALFTGDVNNATTFGFGSSISDAIDGIAHDTNEQTGLLSGIKNKLSDIVDDMNWIPSNSLIGTIGSARSKLTEWVGSLTSNLSLINVNDATYAMPASVATQLTAINTAVFGGFFNLLTNNGLGLFVITGIALIIIGTVL